jgi:hypothetical protein
MGTPGCVPPFRSALYPRDDRISTRRSSCNSSLKFLAATGRRLRALGKVISHFFRKGKLGLKLAIKILFLVEIEMTFETDWNRRR